MRVILFIVIFVSEMYEVLVEAESGTITSTTTNRTQEQKDVFC